jgi:hypothetical protein
MVAEEFIFAFGQMLREYNIRVHGRWCGGCGWGGDGGCV